MHRPNPARQRGATLIEVMLIATIVAILGSAAASGFGAAMHAARANEAQGALYTTLVKARVSAVDWGADVVLCPSADGRSCDSSYHWERGWVAWADVNGNERFDTGEVVVSLQGRLGKGVKLLTSPGRRVLQFQPDGSNAGSNATWTLCDGRGPGRAVTLAMSNAGKLRSVPADPDAVGEACAA